MLMGSGDDPNYDVSRSYAVDRQGRVRVSCKRFPSDASRAIIHFSLKKVGSQYRITDVETEITGTESRFSDRHVKSYQAALFKCVADKKKEFKIK